VRTPAARYDGRVVLVTGGTRGIGLATATAFAAHGAQLVLTHAWGSADEDAVRDVIVRAGGPPPFIVQADASRSEDTPVLAAAVRDRFGKVDAFVSNATMSLVVNGLDDYTERGFMKSMRGGGWPTFDYLTALRQTCGAHVVDRPDLRVSGEHEDRRPKNGNNSASHRAQSIWPCAGGPAKAGAPARGQTPVMRRTGV